MIAYKADWICPATSQSMQHSVLLVDDSRIAGISEGDTPHIECREYPGCAIIPGFVNTHTHLELSLFHGLLERLSFPEWIAELVRIKYSQCTPDVLKVSAQLGAMEMLKAGVTTVGEVMDGGAGWDSMLEFGLQGIAYQEVFGPDEHVASDALRALREKVESHRARETERQRIGVSPHAPYTVSRNLFEGVRDYARAAGLRMTAHIAESADETLFVRDGAGTFAARQKKRGITVTARGRSPVGYLDSIGMLGTDMLLVHAIEADAADIRRIHDTGSFVAHCPRSNSFFGHGIARVAEMQAQGVPVSLGTDSLASNDAIDMFAEMRLVNVQQKIAVDDVFRMATIEGARALGMDDAVGSLEEGKRADFVVVRLKEPATDPVEDMVRYAGPKDIRATFLGGRETVVEDAEARKEIERFLRRRL